MVSETQTETAPAEKVEHTVKEEQRRPGSLLALTIELPESEVTTRVESVLQEFKREAQIPGFRPGKAPLDLVRRRLGKAARGESVARLIPDLCNQIIEERGLETLGEPKVDNLKSEPDEPVVFELILEVKPEIELPDLSGIEVSVEERPVNDEIIDHQLEHIRSANAVLTPKDGKAKRGDALTVDVDVVDEDGNEVEQHQLRDAVIRTGERQSQPAPSEVVKALVGSAAGAAVEVPVTGKATEKTEEGGEEQEKELTWTWKVTVKDVKSVDLPALDDEFAKDVGDFETLDELRSKIRADLEKGEEGRRRDEAVGAVLTQVLQQTSFDAPVTLVAQAQYRTLARDSQYLQQMGMDFSDLSSEKESYFESTRRESEKQVRAELVIDAIGAKAEVEVSDEDVDAEIERMAEDAGRKPLAIRAQLEARKQLDALRGQIRRRKIAEHILDQAKVKSVKAKAPRAKAAKPKAKAKSGGAKAAKSKKKTDKGS